MSNKPMCTNPVHCTGIANPAHRAQFRHQCPFGKNCPQQHDASHCDAFAHDVYAAEQRVMVMAPPAMYPQAPVPYLGPAPLFKPAVADAYFMPSYATLNPAAAGVQPGGGQIAPSGKMGSEWFAPGVPVQQVSALPIAPMPLGPGSRPFAMPTAPMTGLSRASASVPSPPFPGFYLNNKDVKPGPSKP